MSQSNIITPGRGYSSDLQQVSSLVCYNVTPSPITQVRGIVNLNTAMTFQELSNSLQIDISASADIGMFSFDATSSYMRSVVDTDYSFSLNYYQSVEADIPLTLNGYGKDLLTPIGQSVYQNGTNPYFSLVCGDQLIDSYKTGAILMLAMNLQFSNHVEKEAFSMAIGGSYGGFGSASTKIQTTASQTKIAGTVSIRAFQVGGDPAQLSKILSADAQGVYYSVSCSIQNMSSCNGAISGLLNYASQNFPSQVSATNNTGMTSYPVGLTTSIPIKTLGLTLSSSFVSYPVKKAREALSSALNENEYYIEKFNQLLNKYPVTWNQTSNLYKTAAKLYADVNANMQAPMDPQTGGIVCYTDLANCPANADALLQSLRKISQGDLDFLEGMKYCVQGYQCTGVFRRNGDGVSSLAFVKNSSCPATLSSVNSIYLDDTKYSFNISATSSTSGGTSGVYYYSIGYLTFDNSTDYYTGELGSVCYATCGGGRAIYVSPTGGLLLLLLVSIETPQNTTSKLITTFQQSLLSLAPAQTTQSAQL